MMANLLVGTRPEILKVAAIHLVAKRLAHRCRIIHSGQHYDYRLSQVFFKELGLPKPDKFLNVGSGSHAYQIGSTLMRLEGLSRTVELDNLVVVGDTNTVLAGALFASRAGIPLFHVESGARSYDLRMPEEHNRRATDHLSTVLFAPTKWNRRILRREDVRGAIYVTGNPIIDTCVRMQSKLPPRTDILKKLPFEEFVLATAHRSEIVDDASNLRELVLMLANLPLPVVLPCHPRTMKNLRRFGMLRKLVAGDKVFVLPPLGYLDFLALMKRSAYVISDSGGVAEEATAPGLDKVVFSPRANTELPEAVQSGHQVVVGIEHSAAIRRIKKRMKSSWRLRGHPYGTGHAAERIVPLVQDHLG